MPLCPGGGSRQCRVRAGGRLRRLTDEMTRARAGGIRLPATEGDSVDRYPTLAGWVAAVGAKHVLTQTITPGPPAEVEKTLSALRMSLRMYGNNGWADFKTNVGPMTRVVHGQRLADAGSGPAWVVGYFIGTRPRLGLRGAASSVPQQERDHLNCRKPTAVSPSDRAPRLLHHLEVAFRA